MNRDLVREFRSPGSAYRGKPFWAWNGKLDPEELRRQVRVMHRMGLGGFFMHSRVGLDTAYLSDAWFECIDACVDEAKKLDMEAWLYDEDRWPSGAAGGIVTKNPKHRQRGVTMDVITKPTSLRWGANTLAAFTARVRGAAATNVRRISRGKHPRRLARGESILRFRIIEAPRTSWYNGQTYLDTLSHEAVREFIRVTHEAYRKQTGRHFGRTVPGIFTDEPNHGAKLTGLVFSSPEASLPWTVKLPAVFRKRYGYDLVPHLVELFLDVDGQEITPARYHYHDCVTHLFVDAFGRQIGQWCGKNGLRHTGHLLMEDSLSSQTSMVGSCMRFYETMQTPGMDLLTEYRRDYDTAKQVSSAARQFGRKWRLTETYGCTGWDFPFAGHKALGDWQAALGINLRCQHLSWYTMEGEAKRDYPASIFYQSPWWEIYPKVEDYFARIHAVMTRGTEVRDLLVIHPVESMWTMVKQGWRKSTDLKRYDRGYDQMLPRLRDALLAANIDFDYGDEEILSRHGRASRRGGKLTLTVARAAYKAVLVPPLKTMRRSTLELLRRFRDLGGLVIFAGAAPDYVDALPTGDARDFSRECGRVSGTGRGVVRAVEAACRRVSIRDARGGEIRPALHLLREDREAFYLFVCNTGQEPRGRREAVPARKMTLSFPDVRIRGFAGCTGVPLELEPDTGKIFAADARRAADRWEIHTSLPPVGSRLFVVPKKRGGRVPEKRKPLKNVRRRKLDGKRCEILLSESNSLVLDRPRYRIGNGARRRPEEILQVDFAVRDALGIPRRGAAMVQPWARKLPKRLKRIPVTLSYDLDIETVPSGDLFLALEQPRRYAITLNGQSISTDADAGWWTDLSLRKIPVDPSVLRTGCNEVTLQCDYDAMHPGLEILYLLGMFGSRVRGTQVTVTAPPATLRMGDWTKQGLAFYSGSVSYLWKIRPQKRTGQRLIVRVPAYKGAAVRVLVDGKPAGVIGWEPNEVDITDFVGTGAVTLAVEVFGHRRNSHGPFHHRDRWPLWIGPPEFVAQGELWREGYMLAACGLTVPPELIVRR